MTDTMQDDVIRLWPDGPPTTLEGVGPEIDYRGPVGVTADTVLLRNVSDPTLSVFRPQTPNGVGVIVCPGGGWRILTWQHEGTDIARWLITQGYTVFLLKYRVSATPAAPAEFDAYMKKLYAQMDLTREARHAPRTISDLFPASTGKARQAAADDGRRALAIARQRATEWGVDLNKIGMIGFSIGACLAVDVAIDPGAAPLAFVAPIYGGDSGRPVPEDAPPLFAVVAQDDLLVCRLVETLYADWTDAERSAELHVFRRGGHSFGLAKQDLPSDRWADLFQDWLADLGLA
ncbi:alpha/beta hydrolase [Nordella sp. HKS 07]|uniref:alpha/beta hydrolase n=1 Tax=Nordella sp. HKS 07 TaxID=2712222 RepID=UPI0013E121B7|nr:dienelactone hydrolase family protein [Nordella sp. HKS 07]QIG48306.1 alpha/beta hydrolase [Nordella sp. HKS 07]